VAATPLSVVHYTVDLDNSSCGLTFSADRVAYSGNLLLNHPMPGQIKPGMSAITRKRCFPFTRLCGYLCSGLRIAFSEALNSLIYIGEDVKSRECDGNLVIRSTGAPR